MAMVLSPAARAQRLNLPLQGIKETIPLSAETRDILKQELSRFTEARPFTFSERAQKLLLGELPVPYLNNCVEMVDTYWYVGKGKAKWTVKLVWANQEGEGYTALVALSCGELGNSASDERLARIREDGSSAEVHVIDLTALEQSGVGFYHWKFRQGFPVGDKEPPQWLIEVKTMYSDDNPCCDNPTSRKGEWLAYFLFPGGAGPIVAIPGSSSMHHGAGEGPETTEEEEICEVETEYSKNAQQRLTGLTLKRRCRTTSEKCLFTDAGEEKCKKSELPGTIQTHHYLWNSVTGTLERAQPIP